MTPERSKAADKHGVGADASVGVKPNGTPSVQATKKNNNSKLVERSVVANAASGTPTAEPPLPGPSPSAWVTCCTSGEESDWELQEKPGTEKWGKGSRRLKPKKRLRTRGDRSTRRRGLRKKEKKVSIFDSPASDGEEGVKPSRPSDIVGYHSDSCVDFEFDPEDVEGHRRRLRSVVMKVKALRNGKVLTARLAILKEHSMEKYHPRYNPPKEDLDVLRKQEGLDRLWGQRAVKDHRCTTRRRSRRCGPLRREETETSSDGESVAVAGPLGGMDYFESTDAEMVDVEEEEAEGKSGMRVDKDGVIEIMDDGRKENALKREDGDVIDLAAIDEIAAGPGPSVNRARHGNSSGASLPQSRRVGNPPNGGPARSIEASDGNPAGNGAHGPAQARKDPWERCFGRLGYKLAEEKEKYTGRPGILSLGKRLRVVIESDAPRKKKKKDPEKAIWNEIDELLKMDPEVFFTGSSKSPHGKPSEPPKKDDAGAASKTQSKKESGMEEAEGKEADSDASSYEDVEMTTMSVIDKVKADALAGFYNTRNVADVSSNEEEDVEAGQDMEEDEGEQLLGQAEDNVENNPGFIIMGKMDFKGRLGANEDGIGQPIEMVERAGKRGLGMRSGIPGGIEDLTQDRMAHRKNEQSAAAKAKAAGEKKGKKKKSGKKKGEKKKSKAAKNGAKKEPGLAVNTDGDVDNNRRAIIVDFDALTFNSHVRRVAALNAVLKEFGRRYEACRNVASLMTDIKHGNLSDYSLVKKIHSECNLQISKEEMNHFLKKLNAAFDQAAPALKLDGKLIGQLKDVSHDFRIGVLHFGAGKRVQQECDLAGLPEHFHAISVSNSDKAPYNTSWREAFCHAGVHPRQGMLLLSDHGRSRALSGVIAARYLSAKSFVRVQTDAGKGCAETSAMMMGKKNMFGSHLAGDERQTIKVLNFARFLKEMNPACEHYVWAMNDQDRLWHAAKEVWRLPKADVTECEVVFFGEEGRGAVTVKTKDVRRMEERDFGVVEKEGFPGMLDPNVDALAHVSGN